MLIEDHSDIQPILDVLEEPTLVRLSRDGVRDYLSWDELTQRPLPPGLSVASTWRLLSALRRAAATWFPLQDSGGARYWYSLPNQAVACLETVERHCRSDSSLHRAMQEREGHRFIVRARVQEAISTCQLDGVRVSYEEVGRLLHHGRAARNSTERLVLNCYNQLTEQYGLLDEPFTPGLLRSLYEKLAEGVDTTELVREPARNRLMDHVDSVESLPPDRVDEVLQLICDYANGEIGDPTEPVAVKAYGLYSCLGFWHLLPDFNGTVARFVFRLFAMKHDYPVLGYLPISLVARRWTEGELDPSQVRYPAPPESPPARDKEFEYTADVLTFLQLVSVGIDEMRGHMEQERRHDEELLGILDSSEDLNYRQRAILSRALRHGGAEFRIQYHQTVHRIVYATARADLLELVDKGYLRKETRGRAFVFVAVPNLSERIGARG